MTGERIGVLQAGFHKSDHIHSTQNQREALPSAFLGRCPVQATTPALRKGGGCLRVVQAEEMVAGR